MRRVSTCCWSAICSAWCCRAAQHRAANLPFGNFHESSRQAVRRAAHLMRSGAHMVKLEGGGWAVPLVRLLVERGIPVCARLA